MYIPTCEFGVKIHMGAGGPPCRRLAWFVLWVDDCKMAIALCHGHWHLVTDALDPDDEAGQ
jgi:hypothetical protein